MKHVLFIGESFPEPKTTAAGKRTFQIFRIFRENDFSITFATTSKPSGFSEDLQESGIAVQKIELNDRSFDDFIKKLKPDLVVFDRFLTEEKFGWRVEKNLPGCLRILDTQDLHFLRKAREKSVSEKNPDYESLLFSEPAKRELASVFRSDLTLVISQFEMDLLHRKFNLNPDILFYLPFLIEEKPEKRSFENRVNFMAAGSFLHAPNVDMVFELNKIWPEIKEELPDSELHIFGAYAPRKILQLHNENTGFLLKGWAADFEETLNSFRVQLAPLRFGAGLKGKIFDALATGLPTVTTEIGAEGIFDSELLSASVPKSENFAKTAVSLYSDARLWKETQQKGRELIFSRFEKSRFANGFINRIDEIFDNLNFHRQQNFIGQILLHHNLQSTKYFSKWIEEKNKNK